MAKTKKQNFETALSQLEKIVAELESEDLKLDDSLKKFEEGIVLVRFCSQKLDEAEKRIDIIVKESAHSYQLKPFPNETDSSSEA